MGKVIRINEETFARLQDLAEPFVDTPSSVIEKLLNYYESKQSFGEGMLKNANRDQKSSHNQNLFLAPATEANFLKTIRNSKTLDGIESLLSPAERKALQEKSKDSSKLHCWAMTESNRSKFNEMSIGDVVVFTLKGSGKFEYRGTVICKMENEKLGKYLWDFVSNKPWKLIYFLEDINRININKKDLVTNVGYKENYWVPGLTKVGQVDRDRILSEYGRMEDFIDALSKNR